MLAPSVRHLAFVREDGQALPFVPGQFLQIHFEVQGKPLRRSYSIANYAGDPLNPAGDIEIAVSYVPGGVATELLSNLREGESIEASGPYGRFCLHDNDTNARYLLVATGTGVTPYRAMLPLLAALQAKRGIEVCVFYGARNEQELLYAAEFDAFAARVPGFRFIPCFSRAPRTPARADDRRGYVQQAVAEFAPHAERDIAYLCGNPNMVDACFAALKEAGLPIPHIRREKYISPADARARAAAPTE
jgi:ferredoxin-NADP reductase